MHPFSRILALFGVILFASCTSLPKDTHPNIRLVHAGPEIGSAIRLSPRYLVTNIHVIDQGFSYVTDQRGQRIEVQRILRSQTMDLALLVTECTQTHTIKTRSPRKDEIVTYYGPQTLPRRATTLKGKVTRTELYASHPKPLPEISVGMALDSYIPLGFSGGPIEGDDGRIVGMSQGNVTLDEKKGPIGYFYAAPAILDEAKKILNKAELPSCNLN